MLTRPGMSSGAMEGGLKELSPVEERCIPGRIRPGDGGGPGRNLRAEKESGSAPGATRNYNLFYVDGKQIGFFTDKGIVMDLVKENIGKYKDKIVMERFSM
jgi:hypothetical protein